MSKYVFSFLVAVICGLIVFIGGALLVKANSQIAPDHAMLWGFLTAAVLYVLLLPTVFAKIKHICCDLDWADECSKLYHRIPDYYRQSFWWLFFFINLAFLFHTINFMWGNEDWAAVRSAVDHGEGIAQGTFSVYWLQELLFDGKILPVANNLWGFAGLSLAGVLLAIYWKLPEKKLPIVITGLLFAVTPYTLSVLYFVKSSLGIMFLPAMVLTALILSQKHGKTDFYTYGYNMISILLFLWALGTYMPVINFIAVAILGQIFVKVVYAEISFVDAARNVRQGLANFTAALTIYWLILFLLHETHHLLPEHAAALSLTMPLWRLPAVIYQSFMQFAQPLPFMDISYKLMYGIFALIALGVLIFKASTAKVAARGLVLILFLILASVMALAFVANPYQNLVKMGFFGLPFLFALLFVMVLRLGGPVVRRIGYVLAVLIIFMNFVRIAYAEKVWKFGWEAETKLAERIITRLEKMPEFDIDRQYQLLQIGEKSLRAKYYRKGEYEITNGELLDRAYYPEGHAKDAYNFFYQTDFLSGDAQEEALQNPEIRNYLLNQAKAWPAKEGLFIHGSYIVLVLDEVSLAMVQRYLEK